MFVFVLALANMKMLELPVQNDANGTNNEPDIKNYSSGVVAGIVCGIEAGLVIIGMLGMLCFKKSIIEQLGDRAAQGDEEPQMTSQLLEAGDNIAEL